MQYQTTRSSELLEALKRARQKAEVDAKSGTIKSSPSPATKPEKTVTEKQSKTTSANLSTDGNHFHPDINLNLHFT